MKIVWNERIGSSLESIWENIGSSFGTKANKGKSIEQYFIEQLIEQYFIEQLIEQYFIEQISE